MVQTLLVRLMEEDGTRFATRVGHNWEAKCVNPSHNDKKPSMSVEVTQGLYHCHGCGTSGNAFTYLTEIRGMTRRDAAQKLKDEGEWSDEKTNYEVERSDKIRGDKGEKREEHLPRLLRNIPDKTKGMPLAQKYFYHDRDGQTVMCVAKYAGFDSQGEPTKSFLQFTQASRGGWWACAPLNPQVPKEDKVSLIPLYRLSDLLKGDEDKPIWIVEGEKCVELCYEQAFTKAPLVTSLAGGCKTKIHNFDFSPLIGRNILLVADTDEPGRDYMVRLGQHLSENYQCTCRYVLPEGENHYDVGDAMVADGWREVSAWMKRVGVKTQSELFQQTQQDEPPPYDPEPGYDEGVGQDEGDPFPLIDNPFFRILGFDAGGINIIIQKKSTNTLVIQKATSMDAQGSLINIAPLGFWCDLAEGALSAGNRAKIADMLVRSAEAAGIVDGHMTPFGRGCVKLAEGEWLYNLGDRIFGSVSNGIFSGEKRLDESPVYLEPGNRVHIVSDMTKATDYGLDLYNAIELYRFETEYYARRFIGWLVSSLIGGGLEFRPMLWLSAPASTGKTYLIENVCRPVFGGLCHTLENPTPAGITQSVRSDSLPVIIDEFEPEERNEALWRELLGLFRASTSGSFSRVRGTSGGTAISIKSRFSAMVVSINKPRLDDADSSRLIPVKLSRKPVLDWAKVERDIHRATSKQRMDTLRSQIITHAPKILENVDKCKKGLAAQQPGIETRSLLIHSALTAGAGWLSDEYHTTWKPKEEESLRDDTDLLRYIFALQVRTLGSKEETLASLLKEVNNIDPEIFNNGKNLSKNICAQYGMMLNKDKVTGLNVLFIAYETPSLMNLLQGSKWGKYVNLRDHLLTIPGVYWPITESGQRVRPTFAGQRRTCVAVPDKVLEEAGLDTANMFSDNGDIF